MPMTSESTVNRVSSGSSSNRSTASENVAPSQRAGARTCTGFKGEFHELATGWQLLGNGYRAYNPVLMRFHSPDSLSPFDKGGLNAYMYCGGDPVNQVDPTGHGFVSEFLRAIKVRPTVTTLSEQAAEIPELLTFTPSYKVQGATLKTLKHADSSNLSKVEQSLSDDILAYEFFNGGRSSLRPLRDAYRAAGQFAKNHMGQPGITKDARKLIKKKLKEISAQPVRSAEGVSPDLRNIEASIRGQGPRPQNLYR
ncbi:hypothetical protein PS3A_18770 [Pseudomonas sp. 3A(2025)]